MSIYSKSTDTLIEEINNIDENCSEDDQKISDIENDNAVNDYDLFDTDSNTDENEENIFNVCKGHKRRRFLVSTESENEEEVIDTAIDRNCLARNKRRV